MRLLLKFLVLIAMVSAGALAFGTYTLIDPMNQIEFWVGIGVGSFIAGVTFFWLVGLLIGEMEINDTQSEELIRLFGEIWEYYKSDTPGTTWPPRAGRKAKMMVGARGLSVPLPKHRFLTYVSSEQRLEITGTGNRVKLRQWQYGRVRKILMAVESDTVQDDG